VKRSVLRKSGHEAERKQREGREAPIEAWVYILAVPKLVIV